MLKIMLCAAVVFLLLPLVAINPKEIDALGIELLKQRGGLEDEEVGAFLVRLPSGVLSLAVWEGERTRRTAHWSGTIPAGVVGVIHTHPWKTPRPSSQDMWEAQRLGMPMYVVSRLQLCVAEPSGTVQCRKRGRVPNREDQGPQNIPSISAAGTGLLK